MKYSLRSLMVAVTLICVALGVWAGRVEYLRRWAAFHEREAEKFRHLESQSAQEIFDNLVSEIEHESLAIAYRKAVYRPWTSVDENQAKMPVKSASEMGLIIDP
jgi:hypothetical protein